MGDRMIFDYYYGTEAEQFSFYRIPRLLIKDKRFSKLSADAKLLYGLMLDRMSLSMKNGWFDDENRAYIIYKLEEVEEDFGISKPTAVKIMAELDAKTGIGLIEKKKIGLGRPDIIYVKNFVVEESAEENIKRKPEENKTENDKKESSNPDKSTEVKKFNFKKSKCFTSGGKDSLLPEVKKSNPNYNNKNYTENNQTDLIIHSEKEQGISMPAQPVDVMGLDVTENLQMSDKMQFDKSGEYGMYILLIRENIEYDILCSRYPDKVKLIDEMVCLMTDIVSIKRETVRINKTDYPYSVVKSIFLKLREHHMEFVLDSLAVNPVKVGNIKNYLLTMLYNSYCTYHNDAAAYVNHVMNG